jgi:hypothetical protein
MLKLRSAHWELQVLPVLQVLQVLQVKMDLTASTVELVPPVPKDQLVYKAEQDLVEPQVLAAREEQMVPVLKL